jgi:hypothetical protein
MGDTLAEMVQAVVDQRNQMEYLIGEMITTLTLRENSERIPLELRTLAERWYKRYIGIVWKENK